MRMNLLLHFLNRHALDLVGVSHKISPGSRARTFLEQAFRSAILLSETAAVMPPGFFLESEVGFELVSKSPDLIELGLLEFPMRELRLGDMIEKKRSEYASARHEFTGLFDDKRLAHLDQLAPKFISRKTKIGLEATDRWSAGPDTDGNWQEILSVLSPDAVEIVRNAPRLLREDGAALTWPALIDYLNDEILNGQMPVRLALQQNYFELYIKEYKLGLLHELPYRFDAFMPQDTPRQYPYTSFVQLLKVMGLSSVLKLSAQRLAYLKLQPGWTRFADAFVQLAPKPDFPRANMIDAFSSTRDAPSASKVAASIQTGENWTADQATRELCAALEAIAEEVSRKYSLKVRSSSLPDNLDAPDVFQPHQNKAIVTASEGKREGRRMKDVFILTSNENENRAVLKAFEHAVVGGTFEANVAMSSGISTARAELTTKSGKTRLDIAIARETGGAIAANLLRRRATAGELDAVFVVGCAGLLDEKFRPTGVPGEVLPKDLVILAKRATDGDARLVDDATTTSRGDTFQGDRRLIEAFRTMNGMDMFAKDGITLVTNREFISTSAFLASRSSAERKRLVDQFVSDAIVVENEAYAIYDELRNLESESGRVLPGLVIKGISDLGDPDALKNKVENQMRAAGNAAKVVLRFLLEQ